MKMLARNLLLLATASAFWACSAENPAVDIGDSRTGEKLEDYAAVWEGYAEAHSFTDGSDHVKVTLDATGNGILEVGDSAPLPLITDRDALPYSDQLHAMIVLAPGVSYPIRAATVESARIRLSVNPREIDRDWCSLQTSYPYTFPNGVTLYSCIPMGSSYVNDGETDFRFLDGPSAGTKVSARKMALCTDFRAASSVCSCDAQGCSIFEGTEPRYTLLPCETAGTCPAIDPDSGRYDGYTKLDAALVDAGSTLVGTIKFGTFGAAPTSFTVRMKRTAND
jgi:hypothetical protein